MIPGLEILELTKDLLEEPVRKCLIEYAATLSFP